MLGKKIVAVNDGNIGEVKKPEQELNKLLKTNVKDTLVTALENVLAVAARQSDLPIQSFGVFGSMLHGFHSPLFSDIDLTVYGRKNIVRLRKALTELYESDGSPLANEFERCEALNGKVWRFLNFTPREFWWHQKRKLIYSLFTSKTGRISKTSMILPSGF
jgi:predicted nucleotidyltransferase